MELHLANQCWMFMPWLYEEKKNFYHMTVGMISKRKRHLNKWSYSTLDLSFWSHCKCQSQLWWNFRPSAFNTGAMVLLSCVPGGQGRTLIFLVFYLQQGQFSRSCSDPVLWHVSGCTIWVPLGVMSQLALPLPRTGISVPLPCLWPLGSHPLRWHLLTLLG